jgi:transposase
MLKLCIYGYLNQVQSSRRLEREARRNVECMWLTGKLALDFKTIADFRRDHGGAIRAACRIRARMPQPRAYRGRHGGGGRKSPACGECARQELHAHCHPAPDGAGGASIRRYLGMLDTVDRQEGEAAELRTVRLTTRLDALRRQMRELEAMEEAVMAAPDRHISLTDPDARAMASAGGGTALVGYNLQAAVDADTYIVVAHEVINLGHDRTSPAGMGEQARDATGADTLTVLADRGYFSGPEALACEEAAVVAICPKPLTSVAKAEVRFGK